MSLPKLKDISQLFILGDSTSDVGWRYGTSWKHPTSPVPDKTRPLGIDDPCGFVHWCGPESWEKNWVQHLSQDLRGAGQDLLIYDFAVGGSGGEDVIRQTKQMASLLENDVELNVDKAICVIWFGVNDVCSTHPGVVASGMKAIDTVLDGCYSAGLRHVILIDVIPRIKSQSASENVVPPMHISLMKRTDDWNVSLSGRVTAWLLRDGTSGKIFSAHQVFSDVLDSPARYGFKHLDPYTREAGIWADHIHPTTAMHRIVADAFTREFQ